ncbi:TOMM system kinase/cyclase fusion protein [Sorangium sp. So ce117]|uniref:TOMM system kinase/cyclase fusion protein n=1 Tax=Sorangium sp. So ce117 TaxID=3133277 RepID=UPI003F601229
MQCYAADGAALAPGATFDGRYEILAKLGEGGFGVVHKARQLTTGQPIALKILRLAEQGGAAQADRRTARFLRETRLCAQLHHPNIVQLVDAGQAGDGTLYAAFAFAPGDDLAALLEREGALAPSEARHLMLQALDALACAHAAGVVHRDLKPSNIMVIPTGARRNALVLDFGIGATLEDGRSTRLTGSHDALGTPGYGAPEQWRGAEASPRADLFSWGLVFLECLTGKPAYGGTEAEIFYRLLGPDPVPIPAALEHHPLGDLLARALRKDEGARDVTARGLFEALEACNLRGLSREAMLAAGGRPAGGDTRSLSSIARVATSLDRRREPAPPALDGERRQLTALCCHVRARAAVAQALDAVDVERLDEPLRAALARCADLGRRHGGYVAAAFGDDLLVYFGYPSAAEDDARRAARAALAMAGAEDAEDPRSAAPGARIDVSVGLHTGLVVDGNLGDLDGACLVTGATPRLAARLAALAPPGSVAVSAASQALLRASFDLESEGGRAIEGIAAPVETYRLGQEHGAAASWPTPDGSKAPLSGRDQETGLLVERWRRACEGAGQSILITGEPGIGKSRLARALRDRLAREAHTFLEARCSPDTQTSPLRPVVDLLERTLGLDQEPDAGGKIARIEGELAGHGFTLAEAMPLFVPLFSLPLGEPYAPLDVSPQRHKALTLQAVASLLLAIADERPVLLVAEDLHWADPTTMEFLAQLVREAPAVPLCVIMTARPEFSPSFSTADMLLLPLSRLERPHMEEMLTGLSGHKALPPAVIEQVADRADGVPLFAEELLRMMIDARLLVEREDRYELTRPLSGAAIPGTLRALLTARLDRLSRAKQTAQLAAAMGREFSVKVLSAASPLGPAAVAEDLERLMSAGIALRRRRGKEVVGSFKHALVRDAAYESLSTGARQRSHARIAKTLEEGFPEVVRTRPDLLAHHHAAAEQMREAIGYARTAAHQALGRSAYAEASAHASHVVDWIGALPTGERVDAELGANSIRLQALMSMQGWASPDVRALAEKSRALLPASKTTEHTVSTLFALYMHYHVASERAACRRVADELVAFANRIEDPSLQCVAATAKGVGFHAEGRFLDAEAWFDEAIHLYDPARDGQQGSVFGMDCRVWATGQLAWVQWGMGRTTRAFQLANDAIAWAREIKHVPSLGIALLYLGQIQHMNEDKPAVHKTTGELLATSQAYGLPAFEGYGAALASWAAGDLQGVEVIIRTLESLHCNLALTYYGSFLADIEADAGRLHQAIARVETCLSMCTELGEHFFEVELLRRRARYEMRLPKPDRGAIREMLARARLLAGERGMYRFEAAAIEEHRRVFGDDTALVDRLTQIHDSFPDLKLLSPRSDP